MIAELTFPCLLALFNLFKLTVHIKYGLTSRALDGISSCQLNICGLQTRHWHLEDVGVNSLSVFLGCLWRRPKVPGRLLMNGHRHDRWLRHLIRIVHHLWCWHRVHEGRSRHHLGWELRWHTEWTSHHWIILRGNIVLGLRACKHLLLRLNSSYLLLELLSLEWRILRLLPNLWLRLGPSWLFRLWWSHLLLSLFFSIPCNLSKISWVVINLTATCPDRSLFPTTLSSICYHGLRMSLLFLLWLYHLLLLLLLIHGRHLSNWSLFLGDIIAQVVWVDFLRRKFSFINLVLKT